MESHRIVFAALAIGSIQGGIAAAVVTDALLLKGWAETVVGLACFLLGAFLGILEFGLVADLVSRLRRNRRSSERNGMHEDGQRNGKGDGCT